jgi:glycine/D-amino acid oxidase-like deaminating enzyme
MPAPRPWGRTLQSADVVIIGAGVIGLASGYWLAKAGATVVILEKGRLASEASGRATGFLSLRGEQPLEAPLAVAAEELWTNLDEELGYPTEWTPGGRLWVALEEDRWVELRDLCPQWQAAGIRVQFVGGKAAREIAPCLSERTLGGLYTTRGGHANPQRTSQAFAWAFRDRGGEIRENSPAIGIRVQDGCVAAVETPGGSIATRRIVNCAGPQTGLIAAMVGVQVPMAPVRLEAMVTAPLPRLFDVAMVGHGLSLRQTRRGNIHFNGGPHEWIDVDATSEPAKPSTPIVRNIARRLAELMPSIANIHVLRSWAGVVEVTPDQTCIIERVPSPEGMIVATASGHGFGLAPSIGKAICGLVLEGRSPIPIDGLGLGRFAALDPDWRAARGWSAGAYNT